MRFPHTGQLFRQSDKVVDGKVVGYNPSPQGYMCKASHQATSSDAIYNQFALTVTDGFLVYLPSTDANVQYIEGMEGRGTWQFNGRFYEIKGIRINRQGLSTDHIVFACVKRKA